MNTENTNIHKENSEIFNTANKLLLSNKFKEAENEYLKLLGKNIYSPCLYHNLGLSLELQDSNDFIQSAIEVYLKNIELSPHYIKTYLGIVNCLIYVKNYKQALEFLEKALKIDPTYSQVYFIYSEIYYKYYKNIEKATRYFIKGLNLCFNNDKDKIIPKITSSYSQCYYDNAIKDSLYVYIDLCPKITDIINSSNISITEIHKYYKLINGLFYSNIKETLKIGYISSHFFKNTSIEFILPILENHNKEKCKTYIYNVNTFNIDDDITKKISDLSYSYNVFDITKDTIFSDIQNEIFKDDLDILVCLDTYSSYNPVYLILNRKLANTQVTYLGNKWTTLIKNFDYKIIDTQSIPNETNQKYYSESLITMPKSYICWKPFIDKVENTYETQWINHVLCNFSINELSQVMIECLKAILKNNLKMILYFKTHNENDIKTLKEIFDKNADQIEYINIKSQEEFYKSFSKYDLAIDSYPCNSNIGILQSLYNDCPILTLVGEQEYSKIGKSILTTIGCEELIAHSKKELVQKVNELLNNKDKLQDYRKNLFNSLKKSIIMDHKEFTKQLEEIYFIMKIDCLK